MPAFHDFHHLVHAQGVRVRGGLDLLADLVLSVVVNDHGHDVSAHGVGPGLHRLDRAGDAGVDGGAKTAELADLLAHLHMVAGLDKGGAWRAEVLGHGDDHLSRGRQLLDGLFIGRGFHVVGMNAAKERLCHYFTSFFTADSGPGGGGPAVHRLDGLTCLDIPSHTSLHCTPFF